MTDLDATLARFNLASLAPLVRQPVRPAVELVFSETSQDEIPIGGSRAGGVPDLPADFDWPTASNQPLPFLVQLDLTAVGHGIFRRALRRCSRHLARTRSGTVKLPLRRGVCHRT